MASRIEDETFTVLISQVLWVFCLFVPLPYWGGVGAGSAAAEGNGKMNDLLNQERMLLLKADMGPPEHRQYAELAETE